MPGKKIKLARPAEDAPVPTKLKVPLAAGWTNIVDALTGMMVDPEAISLTDCPISCSAKVMASSCEDTPR
jgi:hypothetical protein